MSPRWSELTPSRRTLAAEQQARATHSWAVEIVANRFKAGLSRVFERVFMGTRFGEFARRADPVYTTLLEGMNDQGIAKTMVENWILAHTLATQARFWLEDAIVDLLYAKAAIEPRPERRPRIYSLGMLRDGWFRSGKSIWDVGERWREEIHGRGAWRPLIQERALLEAELIAGEEERRFEAIEPSERGRRNGGAEMTEQEDEAALTRVASALAGRPRPIAVKCNLLIIEPEAAEGGPHTWAIRYINPTTFNQSATIKSERENLLRLRAYLAQEKPFRAPGRIRVVAADLLPRGHREDASGRATAHFSPLTRWAAEALWDFLKVPFGAVTAGIRDAGAFGGGRLSAEAILPVARS